MRLITQPRLITNPVGRGPRGGGVDLLPFILSYQAGGYGHAGGMYNASFVQNNQATPNDNNWMTLLDTRAMNRIRQTGTVRQVKYKISSVSGTTAKIKFKAFRKNGSNYDFVGESEEISVSATGTLTTTLATPIAVQQGDYVACALFNPSGAALAYLSVTTGVANQVRYVFDADITATNTFTDGIAWALNIEYFCDRPAVAVTGDSIGEGIGTPNWLSFYEGDASSYTGTMTSQPGAKLAALLAGLEYQNHALQSQKWDWVRSTGIVSALTAVPKWVIIQCGTNEIYGGRSWATISADMDAVKALCDAAGAVMVVSNVPPISNADDGDAVDIRALNANYVAWCATNSVPLIEVHDNVSQIRVSTGELDDWIPAYNSGDNVHPSDDGKAAIAAQWNAKLEAIV